VEHIPEDPVARRQRLESWADSQEQHGAPRSLSLAERLNIEIWSARRRISLKGWWYADRFLDRGLGTRGIATEPEHEVPDRVAYVPSSWHVLPLALRAVGANTDDAFIDFGCGKGRIVHQAAKRPFRRVIGVEISPQLGEAARAVVAAGRHKHRCKEVEIVICDATRFELPDDITIAYLFDPFRGEILNAVLQNIIASLDRRPRTLRMIYVHPVDGARVLATGRFALLKEQRGGLRDRRTGRAAIFESCG
jgi:SAM-dependent methyltransferase